MKSIFVLLLLNNGVLILRCKYSCPIIGPVDTIFAGSCIAIVPLTLISVMDSKRLSPITCGIRSISTLLLVTSLNSSIIKSPAPCSPSAIMIHFLSLFFDTHLQMVLCILD